MIGLYEDHSKNIYVEYCIAELNSYFLNVVSLWKLTRCFLQYSVHDYYQNLERARERHRRDVFYEIELSEMFSCNREWKQKTFYGRPLQVGRNLYQNLH